MATLQGKKIVIIGGTSGIGYSVAKASLLSLAEHVLVASSSPPKVDTAVRRLLEEPALQEQANLKDRLSGEVLDIRDTEAVRTFFDKIGELDHLVITSGNISLQFEFQNADLDKMKHAFDDRFWGPAVAAQKAKIRPGGSIIFTIGSSLIKPRPNWSLIVSLLGSVDALTRGLALDLAPTRVNVVCPGAVDTELWKLPQETKEKMFAEMAKRLPVRHVASPEEVAEAYLFLMKCNYITGQRLEVDGGNAII